ncbi:helix-turn-helix transcriptional regulator [Oceanobacillus massiliensis]|uniref:helix-turn-helix domain-containing protein n=1 Tax=Oceanobacillus massiliensis TaxID=1465765 RepID=UPI00301A6A8A
MKCNIEELIINSGLKKKYIAEKLNVSVKQLRNYEVGHSLIPIDKAFILADLLNCRVDDLYTLGNELF